MACESAVVGLFNLVLRSYSWCFKRNPLFVTQKSADTIKQKFRISIWVGSGFFNSGFGSETLFSSLPKIDGDDGGFFFLYLWHCSSLQRFNFMAYTTHHMLIFSVMHDGKGSVRAFAVSHRELPRQNQSMWNMRETSQK